ncbi:GntP family gluconate:H+ symporter [Aeromicrobium sp. SORGH_AS981]|uniref:GntP family permease n=1 Tax=Aeromicrobium sp. SORGH_AS_0981 TaxID=3041802 RepID=UPI002865EE0F|nr:GntP family permease [Aeromicrobium sp. SORGH_AS_0981]MDR6119671.1 GntP family gluconate:H+ symporter [Aeromicrobium sp. SORGH_AS_0981]
MDPIDPVHGTGVLLAIALAAVVLLLVLIIRVKLHAFVALVLVSLLTAVATGIPLVDVPTALTSGFGSTLASVALLVGFGVMIGRLLEASGGAQVLADTLVSRFGERRAPLALGVAAFLFGLPIFFDAGLVVFLPIVLTVARRFGGSVLVYALPAAGAFAATHALLPPHPGPVAAGTVMGGDLGVVLLVNLPIAVVSWYVGVYLFSRWVGSRVHVDVPTLLLGEEQDGGDDSTPPPVALVLSILLVPLVLIGLNTVLTTLVAGGTLAEGHAWVDALVLVGTTPVALLLTLLLAIGTLGRRGRSLAETGALLDASLGPVCSVILITGAGGMLGGVLRTSGVGAALTESLGGLGVPLLLQAFLLAAALRVAQGSATVALTTASGLVAAQTADLSDVQVALLVTAVAAGATVLSHVNDSGFWLVSRFFGLDVRTTLRTWTVMETTLGLSALALAAVAYPLVA